MDISGVSNSLLQQISNGATQAGDAVSIKMLRKSLDIQASQATRLIESVAKSMPESGGRLGQHIDIKV